MADTETTKSTAPEVNVEDLRKQMDKAFKEGRNEEAAKLARTLAAAYAGLAEAERKAKEEALAGTTLKVKEAIEKALESLLEEIEGLGGEGIWFSYEFGELNEKNVRLLKSQAPTKTKSSGGGGGKKYPKSTEDMLKLYGDRVMNQETGETYQQFYDANTGSNPRYKVRMHMIRIDQEAQAS